MTSSTLSTISDDDVHHILARHVLADVRAGKVSLARARQVYKVVIDPHTWTVDEAQTAAERNAPAGSAQ